MTDVRPDNRGGLGTVRNAVLLLGLLADGAGYQSLTELAEKSGLSLPTAHRLLRSLALADLVTQDPRSSRYGSGPELARLANRYLERLPMLGALGPYLVQLRDTLDATIEVHALVRDAVVVVDQVDGSEFGPYRRAHAVLPPLAGAGGRLLAARADDSQWARIRDATPASMVPPAGARRHEWAAAPYLYVPGDRALQPGEVGVPLRMADGSCPGAVVALVAPGREVDVETMAGQLTRTADAAMRAVAHV